MWGGAQGGFVKPSWAAAGLSTHHIDVKVIQGTRASGSDAQLTPKKEQRFYTIFRFYHQRIIPRLCGLSSLRRSQNYSWGAWFWIWYPLVTQRSKAWVSGQNTDAAVQVRTKLLQRARTLPSAQWIHSVISILSPNAKAQTLQDVSWLVKMHPGLPHKAPLLISQHFEGSRVRNCADVSGKLHCSK